MDNKPILKAGKISNLTDARFFSSYQVDWLGLNFDPLAEEALTVDRANEIIQWLKGPKMAGEFENREPDEILFAVDQLQLHGVQIGPDIDPQVFAAKKLTVFQKVTVGENAIPFAIPEKGPIGYLVLALEGEYEHPDAMGTSLKDFVRATCEDYPVLLDMAFTQQNVASFNNFFQPAGINLSGGREVATGLKDFNEMAGILEKIEGEI